MAANLEQQVDDFDFLGLESPDAPDAAEANDEEQENAAAESSDVDEAGRGMGHTEEGRSAQREGKRCPRNRQIRWQGAASPSAS